MFYHRNFFIEHQKYEANQRVLTTNNTTNEGDLIMFGAGRKIIVVSRFYLLILLSIVNLQQENFICLISILVKK